MSLKKKYGLHVPENKISVPSIQKHPIFVDSSDSENEPTRPTGLKNPPKRQDRLMQEKAVNEDPTVYQYDEIYDELDKKRTESKLARKDLDKKPKYIGKLLQSAERRKREYERRIERQVQKDREAEGEMFADKESFVTTAYRKKLEEIKQLDEQEEREEYLEAVGDVTKQGNLDGFYRHLYDQKVLYEDKIKDENQTSGDTQEKEEKENKEKSDDKLENADEREEKKRKCEDEIDTVKLKREKREAKYRKRNDSQSEKEDYEEKTVQHLQYNLDADSDFSIDSSDSENEKEMKETSDEVKTEQNVIKTNKEKQPEVNENTGLPEKVDENPDIKVKQEPEEPEEPKPKVNIWIKRTVGTVYEEAVKKYFERKEQRENGTFSRF